MFGLILLRKKSLDNKITQATQAGYELGIGKGYELGFRLGQIEKGNKGFIMAGVINYQLNEILREG